MLYVVGENQPIKKSIYFWKRMLHMKRSAMPKGLKRSSERNSYTPVWSVSESLPHESDLYVWILCVLLIPHRSLPVFTTPLAHCCDV